MQTRRLTTDDVEAMWAINEEGLPGTGQVGFGVDRIENDEQIQVDLVQVHGHRSCWCYRPIIYRL